MATSSDSKKMNAEFRLFLPVTKDFGIYIVYLRFQAVINASHRSIVS